MQPVNANEHVKVHLSIYIYMYIYVTYEARRCTEPGSVQAILYEVSSASYVAYKYLHKTY